MRSSAADITAGLAAQNCTFGTTMPPSRAAAAATTSPKNKSACPLTGIAERLHLATFADARNPILMRHFVRHYATAVGVPLAHFLVFVHGNASLPASREMRALLLATSSVVVAMRCRASIGFSAVGAWDVASDMFTTARDREA